MTREPLDSLIQDLLDGVIDAEQLLPLEDELRSNPKALDRYLAYADLDELIRVQAEIDGKMEGAKSFVHEVVRLERRKMLVVSFSAAAALLLVLGIVLRIILLPDARSLMTYQVSSSSRFEIVRSAESAGIEDRLLGDGDQFHLSQGCMEMKIGTGVRAVLVAPVSMTRRSEKEILLNEGTAWFHVEKDAIGFRVLTPGLEVVDLGTEFGVFAAPDRATEIHVFKGKVRATTRTGLRKSEILLTGQSRSVDPIGRLVELPSAPGNYLSKLPESLPHFAWSFDTIAGHNLPASGTFHGAATVRTTLHPTDSGIRLVPGKRGMALSLNGKGDYAISDWPGFAGNRPRTVSFWIRMPASPEYRADGGIVGWGNEDQIDENAKWKIRAYQESPGGPAFIRLSWGVIWMNGSTPLNDGKWHHIVATTTGNSLPSGLPAGQLYVDGKLEPIHYDGDYGLTVSPPMDTDTATTGSSPLVIGRSLSAETDQLAYFQGEIDELKVFDGYLSENEIPDIHQP